MMTDNSDADDWFTSEWPQPKPIAPSKRGRRRREEQQPDDLQSDGSFTDMEQDGCAQIEYGAR